MQALLASYEKDDALLSLARTLGGKGWTLLGSAGTARFLTEKGVTCKDVAEIVGDPILGHRVVTLSRELHAALLSRQEDARELRSLGIEPIDLVYVTLYPLEEALARGASQEEIIEKTDIGGPTLLRAAAKGGRLALSSSEQIPEIVRWVERGAMEEDRQKLVVALRAAAEKRVAEYVGASAAFWEREAKK
jgi:phosphoribosylaminoimidazolecarboxamide formyltransferase / IMP cyclohydrolase